MSHQLRKSRTEKTRLPNYEDVGNDFDGHKESVDDPIHHPFHLQKRHS